MPEKTAASFDIRRLEILDANGGVDDSLMPDLSDKDLVRLYELLVLSRRYDQRALSLQREGRIGTYPSILGQEAAQVGSAYALETSDWIFPSFREMGVFLTLGYPMDLLYRYWAGDERGLSSPQELNFFPICIAVGTHVPHAVGAALAAKLRGDKVAAVCYLGDGGTSKGDFHEGLNMAGVYKAPVVTIIQNNQWAISVPRKSQSASQTLAQKAAAYGMPGIQVDGNDVFAVYRATREALHRARSGEGPTLIECDTYRISDHTTADDAGRYRSPEEVEAWKGKDPLQRLRSFLEKRGLWNDDRQQAAEERIKDQLDEAVKRAESADAADIEDVFRYTYGELTARQARQLKECKDAGS
ncbi:MAG: pyruvate dehydrogenase (acetyl-transferring) E1 component subunit alpha [Desulfuromonadales bacterium]|nr:pyruvate dehydrogenase (acetyl-transferring) E1 component subunit alpha [Desulfuromonadales bacterium]NIR33295.1 pyruvate dehydrogenase (acetyl-transferring) E1 component subunit alpha [Desulfuromonadales bacterium]NIS43295.1 pyruvate dehydrogenase (acetyl-transferring) E1 component subunit alpha [Desulfuromonadales bacterium]